MSRTGPEGIAACDLEAAFTESSQRVTLAFFRAQIAEGERFGCGESEWVTQLRACGQRLEQRLGESAPVGRLRLVD